MPDRIKLRRGPKSKIDLNVYELGYVTDPNEQRLYFNNGSIVPIPNNKDITDIKTELTKTINISNKNKQDISYLKDNIRHRFMVVDCIYIRGGFCGCYNRYRA